MSTPPSASPSPRRDAVVIGEALVDIVEAGDGTPRVTPGGSPLNMAVGLGRLGLDVALIAELGPDAHGDLVRRHLAMSGVDAGSVGTVWRTSTATARLRADGSADYDIAIDWILADPPTLPTTRLVHTGSIGAWQEPGAAVAERLIAAARPDAVVAFDPNLRPALVADRGPVADRILRLAALADIVKLSDEDAAWLFPDLTADAVAERLLALGPRLVVVTLGAAGSLVRTEGLRRHQPTVAPVVVDTIGAGDAYMSGLLGALLRSGDLERVRAGLPDAAVIRAADAAARSAGFVVGRAGSDPPRATELFGEGSGSGEPGSGDAEGAPAG